MGSGLTAVPLRGIVRTGVSGSSEGMESSACFAQGEVGENATVTVHSASGDRVCPEQLSVVMVKSDASVPVMVMVSKERSPVPVLEMVRVVSRVVLVSVSPKS